MSRMTGEEFVKLVHETYRQPFHDCNNPEDVYRKACSLIPPIGFYVAHVQHLIDVVDMDPKFFPGNAGGIIISSLANKVMNSTDTLYVNADLQKVSYGYETEGFYYGAFLKKGEIIFPGDSFSKLGYGMTGGKIIVKGKHFVIDYSAAPGERMQGGEIVLEQGVSGDCNIGWEMSGGKIEIIGDANGQVGGEMTGGTIYIHGEMYRLGSNFKSGTIIVDKDCESSGVPGKSCQNGEIIINGTHKGYFLGHRQKGGKVFIKNYEGDDVGSEMDGGRIEIRNSKVCPDVGFQMKRGEILYWGNCRSAGSYMTGGKIEITGTVKETVGKEMAGGLLIVNGDADSVGSYMKGGVIKVNGNIKCGIEGIKGGEIYQNGKRLPVGNPISRTLFNMFRNS